MYVDRITKIFTEGDPRSLKAKRNILLAVFLKGVSLLISFLLVPLVLGYLDPLRYGIWLTLSSMLTWVSFFDVGLGFGLRNKLSEALAVHDDKLARTYISTTYMLISIIVVILFLIFYSIFPFIQWYKLLNAPVSLNTEIGELVFIAFFLFCSQFVLKLISVVFLADQNNALVDLLGVAGGLLSYGFILILTHLSLASLLNIGLAFLISPILVLICATFFFYRKRYKFIRPSFRYINFRYSKPLLGLGLQFFVLQIVALLIFSSSNFIISQLLGPSEVTTYVIAFKYFSIITISFEIIRAPFWSAYTEAYVKGDLEWIKRMTRNLVFVCGFFAIVTVVLIFLAPTFYEFWIGDQIKVPVVLNILLGVYVTISNWNNIFVSFNCGVGKIRFHLYMSVIIGLFTIPVSIFFVKQFGLVGIVLGLIVSVISGSFFGPYQFSRIINKTARGIWNK